MNDFSIFHLNVRSLVKNHEDLSPLLANIDHKFSVLAITETWIKDDDPYDLNFDGYNSISNHRSDRTERLRSSIMICNLTKVKTTLKKHGKF